MPKLLKTTRRGLIGGGLLLVTVLLLFVPGSVRADGPTEAEQALLREVMPRADTFSEREGQPPVFKAYRTDPDSGEQKLVGYVFLTSDVPPEELGYSGPIVVLVGMDLGGTLTGVRVLSYREAISRILGDFLRTPGFQEQFAGKHISDPFRVGRDVDGITRATISVATMARGIRNAARRVAEAYLREPEVASPPQEPEAVSPPDRPAGAGAIALEQLERLSWPEMLSSGLVTKIIISSDNLVGLDFSFAYIGSEDLGRLLLGSSTYARAQTEAGARAQDHHLMLLGLDGTYINLFRPERLAIQQGTETFPLSRGDFIFLGEPREGKIAGQVLFIGVLLIDQAAPVTQPFTILHDLRPGMGLFSNEHSLPADVLALVQERPAPALAPQGESALGATFSVVEKETVLSRLITGVSWTRVVALSSLFGLVMYAFLRKSTRVRWVALAYTLAYLGFVDGGLLSISHIISSFKVGPSAYLNDLLLLLQRRQLHRDDDAPLGPGPLRVPVPLWHPAGLPRTSGSPPLPA
jgi:Na+-translocating ferredoxin:NAD+ oxidoreductase RnfG subunit